MDSRFQKCRLCLKLGDFCSIFEQDDSIKLSEMVMSFTNIRIYEGDGFPDRVCTTCIENLSTAYLFKQQCERINELLHKSPELQIDQPDGRSDYSFINKEFHMHQNNCSNEGENHQNKVNNATVTLNETMHTALGNEISDETDSDVDSVKCSYCNESYGNIRAHTCHVTCQIEHNNLERTTSSETLVATDASAYVTPPEVLDTSISPTNDKPFQVSCVLCDLKFDQYDSYAVHLHNCTRNVKLHHFVCPVCHEIYTDKSIYLEHMKLVHFSATSGSDQFTDAGEDCVDFAPIMVKTRKPKAVRRQIGWSTEDIYQEIDCKSIEPKQTPTASPIKKLFSRFGNESFSKQSTPKKVSFRKWIETSKEKTSNYLPFRKYIQNYKQKKSISNYSPIKHKMQVTSHIQASLPDTISDSDYHSPSGTSEENWKLKQNLICACDKKVFMLSEFIHDRDRIVSMIAELGGVVAENTKMEMLATHFISKLPDDTYTGMMVCALATGKRLLTVQFVYDSFRCKKFLRAAVTDFLIHCHESNPSAGSSSSHRRWLRSAAAQRSICGGMKAARSNVVAWQRVQKSASHGIRRHGGAAGQKRRWPSDFRPASSVSEDLLAADFALFHFALIRLDEDHEKALN
ncbi:zinc-finger associated domain (zf-AD) domain-containing protein [Phthorimaea operculella]|nr:zinc-finger associated domain (zf-AD) domain-containing protein [Phthorimaea operculella]